MNKPTIDLRRACLSILAATPFAAAPALSVMAQEESPPVQQQAPEEHQQEPQDRQTTAADIDDEKLDKFAEAFKAVQDIQAEASEDMQSVTDEDEAREIQQKAQEDMVDAVADSGLSVEDYNRVAQLMNTDADVRDGVLERINGHDDD